MKSGRAAKWTARIFRWEAQPDNSDSTKFLDWDDFRTEFQKEFTPAHADALAVNRLESSAYYQRGRSLDDYLDEFQDLITESGYTDKKTIVVKFRRGLSAQIQNAVATMSSGRPPDTSPEQWYEMARTVDQNRAANEAFQSAYRAPVLAPKTTSSSLFRVNPPTSAQGHSHIVPSPGNPVPMDLDQNRKRSQLPALCFRCKKPGHFGMNCPDRFDVRTLTMDELQELLENRLAQLDVTEESPEIPKTISFTEQGFPMDSE
jgi:Retrotransposon gag protein